MATTNENLKHAFAGESQANQKYKAFAKKAYPGAGFARPAPGLFFKQFLDAAYPLFIFAECCFAMNRVIWPRTKAMTFLGRK